MPLQIAIRKESGGRSVTVSLDGSLDTATAPQLEKALDPLLVPSLKSLAFDMARLTFISSAGLRVLLAARKRLSDERVGFAMVHLQPQIEKVFEIVRALPGIKVFQNAAEFDAYLADIQKKASR